LILSVSDVVGTLVEPGAALLSDAGRRRRIVLGGGVLFVGSLLALATAPTFAVLLVSAVVFSPASGAFVGLAQATWMDLEPDATERNMARWVVAGSVGALAGPLLLGAAPLVGFGWRGAILAAAMLTVPVLVLARQLRYPQPHPDVSDMRTAIRGALTALRSGSVLRWLAVLPITDLFGDVFLGYLALYLVDIAGASPQLAIVGVAILAGSSLAGDALLLPALRRIEGVRILQWSAKAALLVYPLFLLAGALSWKLTLLASIGILRAGWYAIPKARLYAELPSRGGTAVAVAAPADLVESLLPLGVGAAASWIGLDAAMWLLLAAPIALLVLLPRVRR
jgi:FSR family fosmidomycin resistance protein-like MFS transporter